MNIPNIDKCMSKRRYAMPQISDSEDFLNWIESQDVSVKRNILMLPSKLIPTQKEFNENKIESLRNSKDDNRNGILVSKDNYIIDGHHRWLAKHLNGDKINTSVVDLSIDDALETAKKYPKIMFKKLSEENLKTFFTFMEEDDEDSIPEDEILEIESMIDELSQDELDEILFNYDEQEDEDDDSPIKESIISEALSRQERIHLGNLFRRRQPQLQRKKEIITSRVPSLDRIKKRARREAISAMKKKFAKKKNVADLSFSEKERIEKRVNALSKRGIIDRISKRLVNRVRERALTLLKSENK